MNPERIQELAALSATGSLECPDAIAWARLLGEGDTLAWRALAANRQALAAVALALCPPRLPSAGLRDRILAQARAGNASSTAPRSFPGADASTRSPNVPRPPRVPAFRNLRKDEGPWLPMPMDGLRVKVLSLDPSRNYALVYAEIDAGVGYPSHHHAVSEEIYVLSGDLRVNGTLLQAGDFHHAEADTDHAEVVSIHGCTALLLVPADSVVS